MSWRHLCISLGTSWGHTLHKARLHGLLSRKAGYCLRLEQSMQVTAAVLSAFITVTAGFVVA
jgi:hypothetical protein